MCLREAWITASDISHLTHLLHVPHVGAGQDVRVDVGGGPVGVGVGVTGEGPPPRVEHKLVGYGAGDAPQDRAHPEHPVLAEPEINQSGHVH